MDANWQHIKIPSNDFSFCTDQVGGGDGGSWGWGAGDEGWVMDKKGPIKKGLVTPYLLEMHTHAHRLLIRKF